MALNCIVVLSIALCFCYCRAQYCVPTQEATEGPYYVPNAPQRGGFLCQTSLAEDRLLLTGRVYDSDCLTGLPAQLDLWQANNVGVYSTAQTGMFCRTKMMTNATGHFQFTTVFPGRYGFQTPSGAIDGYRPAHIHMKVTPLNNQYGTITTQTYFKNDMFLGKNDSCIASECHSDNPTLIIEVTHRSDIKTYVGNFNIIMRRGYKYCTTC